MLQRMVVGVGMVAMLGSVAGAQTAKPAAAKPVINRLTVKADNVYTGTMETTVVKGKVTGKMRITAPTEIVGDVAGTSKGGVMTLEFPYRMVERQCDGRVRMEITLPAKPGPATGTMEAVGCGRDASQKLTGTVELVPDAAARQ